jgi:hypothetical protein
MAFGQAISTVGSVLTASSQTARTLSINPTTIGNLFLVHVAVESITTTTMPTAVAGGHCVGMSGSGNFTSLITLRGPGSGGNLQLSLWAGVATATGALNITATTTANTTTWVDITALQLTCTSVGASTVWVTDTSPAALANTTASLDITWPTFTPLNANSGYFGFTWQNGGSPGTTGQTAGYTVTLDANGNAIFYNAAVSGTQSPISKTDGTARQTSTLATLFTAVNPAHVGSFMPFFGMGHHEDELERRSSGLYVQRRKLAGVRPNGGKDRVLARV